MIINRISNIQSQRNQTQFKAKPPTFTAKAIVQKNRHPLAWEMPDPTRMDAERSFFYTREVARRAGGIQEIWRIQRSNAAREAEKELR